MVASDPEPYRLQLGLVVLASAVSKCILLQGLAIDSLAALCVPSVPHARCICVPRCRYTSLTIHASLSGSISARCMLLHNRLVVCRNRTFTGT